MFSVRSSLGKHCLGWGQTVASGSRPLAVSLVGQHLQFWGGTLHTEEEGALWPSTLDKWCPQLLP